MIERTSFKSVYLSVDGFQLPTEKTDLLNVLQWEQNANSFASEDEDRSSSNNPDILQIELLPQLHLDTHI